jgi:hypothetical protein
MLWVSFGSPLVRLMRALAHVAVAAVEQVGAWLNAAWPRRSGRGDQEVALTFDELALIYKSLQAAKTLGALSPQDELLEDTIQLVDQALNGV